MQNQGRWRGRGGVTGVEGTEVQTERRPWREAQDPKCTQGGPEATGVGECEGAEGLRDAGLGGGAGAEMACGLSPAFQRAAWGIARDLGGGGMVESRRLTKVVHLQFCPFSGNDCLELESSMAESRLRAPDLGR